MPKRPAALLALLSVLPFLVGFGPPEEPGTHVSVGAGQGRFTSSPGCANPRLVEVTDQQVGAYHRWKPRGEWKSAWGLGADLDILESREKECTEEDCRNAIPGWSGTRVHTVLSPYATLDTKWVGIQAGFRTPLYPTYGDSVGEMRLITRFPARGSLRLGPVDRFYISADVLTGQPTFSGSTFPYGVGGRLFGTDLWMAPGLDFNNPAASGRIGRSFGPVRVTLGGRWNSEEITRVNGGFDPGDIQDTVTVRLPEFSFSAALSYRLPF